MRRVKKTDPDGSVTIIVKDHVADIHGLGRWIFDLDIPHGFYIAKGRFEGRKNGRAMNVFAVMRRYED